MASKSFVTLVQVLLVLLLLSVNASLQAVALSRLYSINDPANDNVTRALMASVLLQFLAILAVIVIAVVGWKYGGTRNIHDIPSFINVGLLSTGAVLLTGGIIGGYVAAQLQCSRNVDPAINDAYWYSSISSLLGITGAFAMLLLQISIRREGLAKLLHLGEQALPRAQSVLSQRNTYLADRPREQPQQPELWEPSSEELHDD